MRKSRARPAPWHRAHTGEFPAQDGSFARRIPASPHGIRICKLGTALIDFYKWQQIKEKGGGPGLPASQLPLAGNVRLT